MRVRFVGHLPLKGYSGGRLAALSMAESLAMVGAEVDFIADHIPEMHEEFESFSRIQIIPSNRFLDLNLRADRSIDLIVIIPNLGRPQLHQWWLYHALLCKAKVVLLNYESPNWFNAVSPFKRDERLWRGWVKISRKTDMILSISREGDKYAKQYYKQVSRDCLFEFCYPGINSLLADQVQDNLEPKKQILMLSRLDPHKGTNILEPLLDPALADYQLVLCIGRGALPVAEENKWRRRFNNVGMGFKPQYGVTGMTKFKLLKESSLLYFPSRFEGFGLPPLEAAYCHVPCACSELPVLREVGQEAYSYGDPTNLELMQEAIQSALLKQDILEQHHERFARIAKMEELGKRLFKLFERIIT
jgi:glycosyltransferase involved in cell wall biosynthesis